MPNSHKPEKTSNRKTVLIAVLIAVLAVITIVLLNDYWFIWAAMATGGFIILASWCINPHKILMVFVASNIVLDVFAIAVWAAFPATQWSIYQLGFTVVGTEAAIAAAVYAVTFFGLIKHLKWAPFLAVALTVTQRCFATYVFFPSTAIAVTTVWSLLIVYSAVRDIKYK